MHTSIRYHGTDGDTILKIILRHEMKPSGGKIFFARNDWADCLGHGADRKRKAAFAIKVEINIPKGTKETAEFTPDQIFAAIIESNKPLKVKVLELYVRRKDATEAEQISGETAIKAFLKKM